MELHRDHCVQPCQWQLVPRVNHEEGEVGSQQPQQRSWKDGTHCARCKQMSECSLCTGSMKAADAADAMRAHDSCNNVFETPVQKRRPV